MATAEKLRKVATAFYVNLESVYAVTKNGNFTPEESLAVRKAGESIEQRFQELCFAFFSCYRAEAAVIPVDVTGRICLRKSSEDGRGSWDASEMDRFLGARGRRAQPWNGHIDIRV